MRKRKDGSEVDQVEDTVQWVKERKRERRWRNVEVFKEFLKIVIYDPNKSMVVDNKIFRL